LFCFPTSYIPGKPFNPAGRVKPPKVKKKQAACYDEEQLTRLLAALEKDTLKHKTLVVLALFTGLRRGELMGLEWQDVNLEEEVIEVRQASQYVPGIGRLTKEPKNETSARLVAVPPSIMALVKEYRKEWVESRLKVEDLWQGSERLFVTWDGLPGHPEWPSQWFSKFIQRHNLPPLPFHGLRHTAATMLINQGIPDKNISGRLGHSNISTTIDIYGHLLRSADKEAAARLEEYYTEKLKAIKQVFIVIVTKLSPNRSLVLLCTKKNNPAIPCGA
jgi:integrase